MNNYRNAPTPRDSPAVSPTCAPGRGTSTAGLNIAGAQSEFDVCVTCGSLAQCPHDQEDEEAATVTNGMAQAPSGGQSEPENGTTRRRGAPSTCEPHAPAGPSLAPRAEPVSRSAQPNSASRGTPTEPNAEIDTCDMVCNLPIAPWTEVFNTYGEHLTNAQLLARYGFALDGNDNDVVTLRPADLSSLADVTAAALRRGRDTVGPLYRDVLEIFPRYDRWEGSSLVYQPDGPSVSAESGASSGDDGRGRPSHGHGRRMCVNSDARVSHALWVYCATLAVLDIEGAHRGGEPPGAREVAAALRQLAGCQLALEARSDAASSGTGREADADDDEGDGDLPRHEGTVNSDKVRFISCYSLCAPCYSSVCHPSLYQCDAAAVYGGPAGTAMLPRIHQNACHSRAIALTCPIRESFLHPCEHRRTSWLRSRRCDGHPRRPLHCVASPRARMCPLPSVRPRPQTHPRARRTGHRAAVTAPPPHPCPRAHARARDSPAQACCLFAPFPHSCGRDVLIRAPQDTQILAHLARSVTWACTRSPRAARLGRRTPAGDPPSAAALGAMLDVSAPATSPASVSCVRATAGLSAALKLSYHVTQGPRPPPGEPRFDRAAARRPWPGRDAAVPPRAPSRTMPAVATPPHLCA